MPTEPIHLEVREAEPLDAETLAAVDLGDEQLGRGETMTLEEATALTRKQYQAWRKIQQEVLTA